MDDYSSPNTLPQTFVLSTLSGGLAGLTVDVTLYPLDAFKTRLQSKAGFWGSGGFSRPYAGISAVVVSSIPSAALFFAGYESTKHFLLATNQEKPKLSLPPFLVHMVAAGIGEVTACLVRVPSEVVKQRTQAKKARTVWAALRNTIAADGVLGLYRGFGATIARDVPFAFIQYPLWEVLKEKVFPSHSAGYSAMAGFIAGGVTGAVTTPLDVVKTRIMLSTSKTVAGSDNNGQNTKSVIKMLISLWKEGGVRVLFSGVMPRVWGISCGGAIFLGSYDYFKNHIILYIPVPHELHK